jgi:hypothetical protein
MTPMERAWMILKRQTTLGEFHPDFPSPYGEVTHYHGTSEQFIPDIMRQGILQSQNDPYGTGVYATDNVKQAEKYAVDGPASPEARINFDLERHIPKVIAIRGRDLPFSTTDSRQHLGEGRFELDRIDPRYLVRG